MKHGKNAWKNLGNQPPTVKMFYFDLSKYGKQKTYNIYIYMKLYNIHIYI